MAQVLNIDGDTINPATEEKLIIKPMAIVFPKESYKRFGTQKLKIASAKRIKNKTNERVITLDQRLFFNVSSGFLINIGTYYFEAILTT